MTATDIFLVDSNLLIYNYDTSDLQKHSIAKTIMDKCWDNKLQLAISSQNLSEFFYVTTRKKIIETQKALKILSDIIKFSSFIKLDFDRNIVLEAASISVDYGMHYWDALLAATMRKHGIFNLYTENHKDFKVPWLNVVNPFETIRR